MEILNFNNFEYVIYNVHLIQINKKGFKFRYFSAVKNLEKPRKFINKVERYFWKHLFIEIDTKKLFYIEVDYNDKPISANYIKTNQ